MTDSITKQLSHGDLRSIGNANELIKQISTQQLFDDLFDLMFHKERVIAMRAADALEKISQRKPFLLRNHKNALVGLLLHAENMEVKWHVALMISRLKFSKRELEQVWFKLKAWALDTKESRIVRVNAIQAMYDLLPQCNSLAIPELLQVMETVAIENIPSIKARLKRLYVSLKDRAEKLLL